MHFARARMIRLVTVGLYHKEACSSILIKWFNVKFKNFSENHEIFKRILKFSKSLLPMGESAGDYCGILLAEWGTRTRACLAVYYPKKNLGYDKIITFSLPAF